METNRVGCRHERTACEGISSLKGGLADCDDGGGRDAHGLCLRVVAWASENTRKEWHAKVQKASRYTQQQINRGQKVLERVSLAWRAKKVSRNAEIIGETADKPNLDQLVNIYCKLDAIADDILRATGASLPRVDFGCTIDTPPTKAIFPCMISKAWRNAHPDLARMTCDDPEGHEEIWLPEDLSE